MTTPSTTRTAGRRTRRRPRAAAVLALSLTLAGACGDAVDRLLTVTTPSRLADDKFLVPENAGLIVSSAVADFECAYGAYVVVSGLASGELTDASQTAAPVVVRPTGRAPGGGDLLDVDVRRARGVHAHQHRALHRRPGARAARRLDRPAGAQPRAPDGDGRALRRLLLHPPRRGLLLGRGERRPRDADAQVLDSAEARFTRAIALATAPADSTTLRAAYVGRARARLGKGARAGAAEDAARVPTGFVLNATADNLAARRNNRVFEQNNSIASGVTVAPAYRALTVGGVPDPRVRITDQNRPSGDQINRWFSQNKYTSLTASIPIATGVEARLIEAEARGGAEGVAIVNAVRARAGVALPALTAAEAASFQATVLEERRRELFLQGTRWFDVRRANLPLEPATGSAYPKGGVYGSQRCWPLPDVERAANPTIGG
jgi:hypothetical protein